MQKFIIHGGLIFLICSAQSAEAMLKNEPKTLSDKYALDHLVTIHKQLVDEIETKKEFLEQVDSLDLRVQKIENYLEDQGQEDEFRIYRSGRENNWPTARPNILNQLVNINKILYGTKEVLANNNANYLNRMIKRNNEEKLQMYETSWNIVHLLLKKFVYPHAQENNITIEKLHNISDDKQ